MKNKTRIYIIKDDDTGECHAFKNRKNAINTMYYKCKEWRAILFGVTKIDRFFQYQPLDEIYNNDEEKLNYLYPLSENELCDIFEAYWSFRECEIEDEED